MSTRNFETARKSPFYKAQLKILNFMRQIENIMLRENISHKNLAKAMNVTPAYISKLFNCNVNISLITMEKLASALHQEISQPELYDTSMQCYGIEDFKTQSKTKFSYKNDNIDLSTFTESSPNYSQQISIG